MAREDEAQRAFHAAHGRLPENQDELVSWLLEGVRTAEAGLERLGEASRTLAQRAADLAAMSDQAILASRLGASLPPPNTTRLRFSGWTLDTLARGVTSPSGLPIHLTTTEFEILRAFLAAPNRVLTRDDLADALSARPESGSRAVDIHIARLRRKLELDPRRPVFIKTVFDRGYVFTAPPEAVFALRRGAEENVSTEAEGWLLEVDSVDLA
jgi:DNA-binding winged helix-turn-helix (wHTH) protein